MKLNYSEQDDLIFIDKPYGYSSHAQDHGKIGLAELYSKHLAQEILVVHRLDKTTSGAMVFAKNKIAAERMRVLFTNREIKKKYWFVTDRVSQLSEISHRSFISSIGKTFNSDTSPHSLKDYNSETQFTRVKRTAFFELWEARPLSGKSHQIRLHAADIGLPILGDSLYGGSVFPRLCLHSMEIEIPGFKVWSCPPPRIFERLSLLKDLTLSKLVSAIDTRQRLFNFLKFRDQTLRLSHLEDPDIRIDFLGSHLWVYWYKDSEPNSADLARFETISSMLSASFVIRRMKNRGSDPNTNNTWEGSNNFPEQWLAKEGNLQFQFFKNRGLSPGLFLDQRNNREWVSQNAENKSVLNLFAYSCGFSVAAAAGGAKEVCSVDVSSDFLNWGKENFELNNLPVDKFEFFKQDSILFLDACIKRQRRFDIIICDPPTFGRHKGGIFKLEKDWKTLLQKIADCLQPKGTILFSNNLENWSTSDWETKIKSLKLFREVKPMAGALDFEGPNDEPLMKAFRLQ